MEDSLTKLPPEKQVELRLALDIIRKKCEGVQMIILFGSYSRGKAIEHIRTEGHMTVEYKSDFDILVITEKKKQANDLGMQNSIEDTCFEHKDIDTTVAPIYHHIDFINKRLAQGQYFFSDIKEFGIMLYDSGKYELAEKKELPPAERKRIAREDFNHWFKKADEFYANYEFNLENEWYETAAFMLHQATEFCYAAVQLVFTGYKHPTHNIEKLGRMAAKCDPKLYSVFPRATEEEKKRFKKLKQAYVDARYKEAWEITEDQLTHLGSCVKKLHQLAKVICKEEMDSFV